MLFWKNFLVILVQRKTKTQGKFGGAQCIISGRISRLAPNSRASNIENIEDSFHLYFDNDIIDKIFDCKNTRTNGTKASLQRSGDYNESGRYTWIKKNQVELKLMRCLNWCISEEYLEWIFICLIDYSQMTFILLLVQ